MTKSYSNFRNQIKTILFGFSLLFTLFFFSTNTANAQAFRTTWVTTDGTITIPAANMSGYSYNVTWTNLTNPSVGNGSINLIGSYTIRGLSNGDTYELAITGRFPYFKMDGNIREKNKLRTIEAWGNIEWTSMENAFSGCQNLTYNATDVPNLSRVTNMSRMFKFCEVFNGSIGNWNTSNVTNMREIFAYAYSFNQPIGNWNTSNVTNMREMFYGARIFNQPIGNWNTSNVTDMHGMFNSANSFNQPIGNWNTENVSRMSWMFVSAISFNQPIGNWNTSAVRNMKWMFTNAYSFNQPIGNWNTENVTDMRMMFSGATSFNQPIGNWNTENVTDMSQMFGSHSPYRFSGATSFNQPIGNWNTSRVVRMNDMFKDATSFNQSIGSWDVSNVTTMANMLDGSGMNTSNYDATLIGWAAQSVRSNIPLGADGLTYCNGTAARSVLTSAPNSWIITGDLVSSVGAAINNITLPQNQFNLCPNTSTTLEADGNGVVTWYNSPTNPVSIHTGSSFTTPILTADSTYFYVQDSVAGCGVSNRLAILVTTSSMENITPPQNQFGVCLNDTTVLEVSGNGTVYWYDSPTNTTPVHIGTRFTTPILTQDSTYFYAFDSIAGCNNGRLELLVTALQSLNAVSKTNYTAYLDASGQVEIDAILLDSISSAGCGNTVASYLYDDTGLATRSFSCIDSIQNVVLRVTDSNGNTDTSSTVVHVKDTIPPTFATRVVPVHFGASNQAVVPVNYFITALNDNCTDSTDISVVFNHNGRDSVTLYCGSSAIRNLQLRVTDRAGNVVIQPVQIRPTSSIYDFNVNIIGGIFRPDIPTTITVLANNYSCAPKSGELKVTLPNDVAYNSASITPNRIVGNNLFWDVIDLNYDRNFIVRISVTPDISLNIGDEVCFSGHVTPEVNDVTRLNNLKQYCFPIVNSYDPNDKQVYPQGICDEKFTKREVNQPLTYTIRFQNTGNAPALNVRIADSLSNLLNRRSLRVVATSHTMTVDTTANNNVINFVFNNINLPDSTTSPELSQGYVIFELSEIAAHTDTSRIENRSFIYFDTNAPIITNTVKNTIVDVLPQCNPTTPNPPIADCTLPTNLSTEILTSTRVKLLWNTPSNTNAVNYEVLRNGQRLATIPASNLSFVDSTLTANTQYNYSIKAICGNSTATSNSVQVRTLPSTPILLSVVAACKGERGTINVQSAGATYRVYDSETASTPLFETNNASIETPVLSDSTTFYISVVINGQESQRLEAVVPIKEVFEAIVEQGTLLESCATEFTLSAQNVDGATYTWFRENVQVGTERTLTTTFEARYKVVVIKNGCSDESEFTTTRFVDAPTARIEQGNTISFCGSGILNAQDTSANVTYEWILNGATIGNGTSISVSESGTYTLKASQPSCADSITIAVTITTAPTNVVLTASKTAICPSEETTLSATTGTGFTYRWFRNNTVISNTSATLSTSEIGTYKVEITTQDGCKVTTSEVEITRLLVNPAILRINTENGNDKTIDVTSQDAIDSVMWFKDGVAIPSFANQILITPTETGNYKAQVVYETGCSFETEEKTFTVGGITGIEEESAKIFTIYPNPNNGSFKVEFATTTNQKTNLVLVDGLGRIIHSQEIAMNEKTLSITLPKISAGVYVVQIVSEGKVYTKQLVIQ
ncbi:BspA family leucine-rich repeat surface protein [Bernardetia sp. OM2101]|uniref:BspA family leucine-rich repeat surface protein n=1 Tax=Bernardetia sp. OM2101 TaxID=3344876 RepID=UPI0035D12AF2